MTVAFDPLSSRCSKDRRVFDSLALPPRPIRCPPGESEKLIVDCDGRVLICCQDFRREEPIGDLSRASLLDVLLSPERRRVDEQFAAGRHTERQTCARCFADVHGAVERAVRSLKEGHGVPAQYRLARADTP